MTEVVTARPNEVHAGTTTEWKAVTEPWPSISECATALYNNARPPDMMVVAYDPYYGINFNTRLTCLPPVATSWWMRTQTPLRTITSMGPVACPEEYTTASASTVSSGSVLVACCPSQYQFISESAFPPPGLGQCQSEIVSGQVLTMMEKSAAAEDFTLVVRTATTSNTAYAVPINGFLFAEVSRDLASSSDSRTTTIGTGALSTSTTPTNRALPTSIPPQTSQPTSVPLSSDSSSSTAARSSSLDSGAKIGIGIGVSFTVLGICCAIGAFCFVRRHVRGGRKSGAQNNEVPEAELPAVGVPMPAEMDSKRDAWENRPKVYEMHVHHVDERAA
ncbi:hypothetical protein B0O99DRAFT_200541 [Bisporella sp. PMI_857]|nr:hypothetical protein B0O99DRAFT_200541 [Bisporella sp. PMI_857]